MHVLRSFQTVRTGTFHDQNDLVWMASTRGSLTGHWRLSLRPGAQLISQWETSGGAQGCGRKSASYRLCFCPRPDLFRWAPPLRSSRTAQQITCKNTGSLSKIQVILEFMVPRGPSMTFAVKSPIKIFTFKCSKSFFFFFLQCCHMEMHFWFPKELSVNLQCDVRRTQSIVYYKEPFVQ